MDAILRAIAMAERPRVDWGWLVTHATLVDILDLLDLVEYDYAIALWREAERK